MNQPESTLAWSLYPAALVIIALMPYRGNLIRLGGTLCAIVALGSLGELSSNRMHRNGQGDRLGSKGYLRPVMPAVRPSFPIRYLQQDIQYLN